jgi:hypothetical protein
MPVTAPTSPIVSHVVPESGSLRTESRHETVYVDRFAHSRGETKVAFRSARLSSSKSAKGRSGSAPFAERKATMGGGLATERPPWSFYSGQLRFHRRLSLLRKDVREMPLSQSERQRLLAFPAIVAFGFYVDVDMARFISSHRSGFSIKMSPKSRVSPGFTVNSLRSCGPVGVPNVV